MTADSSRSNPSSPGDPASVGPLPQVPPPAQGWARILVVEDEPINVKVIQKFLAAAGYHRVFAANNGLTALEMMAAEMPDLLLLDIFFADGINGIEVLERVRELPAGPKLPVLILTASDDPEVHRRAHELGVHGLLCKPIKSHELIGWVGKCLE